MAALERRLVTMQAVLQDVLDEEKARLAGLQGLDELRREVQELKSEVRLQTEGGHASEEETRNREVVQQWVQQSVLDLRQEMREVEVRLEKEQQELHLTAEAAQPDPLVATAKVRTNKKFICLVSL